MYQRRLNYASKKRKYPYSKRRNYNIPKYRKANNASSYFSYDGPRAKSITRLNAAIGSELKQFVHISNIAKESLQVTSLGVAKDKNFAATSAVDEMPCEALMQRIQQGAAYNQRIGDKITVKSIDFRLKLDANFAHFEGSGKLLDYAIFIILDRSPNGSSPKWADIFHWNVLPDTLNQKHMKNENRFQILKTFQIPLNGILGNVMTNGTQPRFLYYKFKKPTIVKYQSNAATLADVTENQFWICAVTHSETSTKVGHTTEGPMTIKYSANIRYYDS